MKKILLVLLSLIMIFTICACGNKEEIETGDDDVIAGGYTEVEDGTITEELEEIFNAALENYDGADLIPLELLETQVVAGLNYKFLAKEGDIEKIVVIYKDLSGNCTITDVKDK